MLTRGTERQLDLAIERERLQRPESRNGSRRVDRITDDLQPMRVGGYVPGPPRAEMLAVAVEHDNRRITPLKNVDAILIVGRDPADESQTAHAVGRFDKIAGLPRRCIFREPSCAIVFFLPPKTNRESSSPALAAPASPRGVGGDFRSRRGVARNENSSRGPGRRQKQRGEWSRNLPGCRAILLSSSHATGLSSSGSGEKGLTGQPAARE